MSIIDGVIPAAVVVCALVVVGGVRVRRVWVAVALGVIAGLAVIQLITEGFYWQFLPTYVLLCVTALFAFFPPGRRAWSVVSRVAIALLIVPAAGAWAVTPVPELPAPSGPYLVGTETFRWVDPARDEPATPDPDDRRAVIAQAWYPAAEPTGRRAPYLDGLGDLPASVSGIPGFVFGAYADVDTLGELLATPHPDRERWPVVLFSPGYGAPRGFYTGLVAELASRGFVVLAVDHPYESAVTELPGGDLATPVAVPADPDEGERYMAAQQDVRASDLRFVLDRLDALGPRLTGRVDTEHVAVIGHSFGGAAAAATAAADPGVRAAANIDGTPYGSLPEQALRQPFLLVESDRAETGHSRAYLDRNEALLTRAAEGYRYEITEANHYSFTDTPLFLTAPGRFALAQVIGGSRGPEPTQRATVDILAAFLSEPLGGVRGDPTAAAGSHPGVRGGPVG